MENKQTTLFDFATNPRMDSRRALAETAYDTLQLLDELDDQYAEAELYTGNVDTSEAFDDGAAVVHVIDGDVVDVAKEFLNTNPCVLNFASALVPGGGWLSGALAQEECIARRTSLYKSISGTRMYERNALAQNPYYLDDMIYSPHVRVLKDACFNRLPTEYDISVVSAAAVNIFTCGAIEQKKLDEIMMRRVQKVLDIMAAHKHRTVILGAWGCGAFGQDAANVAEYFYEALFDMGYADCFDNIVFAIYKDESKLEAFQEVFKNEMIPAITVG